MQIDDLIERVRGLEGPSREVDALIADRFKAYAFDWSNPYFTASLDAAVALVERVLPGWWWKVGTCCVSDDACIAPGFNSSIHGERLKAEFFPLVAGSEFDAGFDVDRRPPGNVPIALIEALLLAVAALPLSKEEGK